MADSLRILHTADSHIGRALPSRPRRDGPRRGDDFVDSYRRVLDQARARDVHLVIHAGDLFNAPDPSSRALTEAAEPLLDLATAGIPVVIVPGNHERSVIPTTLLLAHANVHVIREPCTLTFRLAGRSVAVSAFPSLRRRSAARFESVIEATGWTQARADLHVLAIHETFESATCGPGNFRFRPNGEVIPRDAVPPGFDYVAAGHVHRHQILKRNGTDEGPPIVYCGSPDRISFAEVDEPKGSVLVREAAGAPIPEFLEHSVRPMSVWPVDVTGLSAAQIRERLEGLINDLPPQSIADIRLSGRCSSGALRGLRFAELARSLRPDTLLTASTRAIEFDRSPPGRSTPTVPETAFAVLDAPAGPAATYGPDELALVPAECGVYVLRDREDRVLYVGKARSLRTRLRTHHRRGVTSNFFAGWTDQIARIEIRAAYSELEALLVEAELIRRLRPPFNRRMRQWGSYCYLGDTGKPHQQLEVMNRPRAHGVCFGPFRSRRLAESIRDAVSEHFRVARCPVQSDAAPTLALMPDAGAGRLCQRYFDGDCTGPCAGRVCPDAYGSQLAERNALLAGTDARSLESLEHQLEEQESEPNWDSASHALARRARTLRLAFDHAALLQDARRLVGGLLLLPGPEQSRTVVFVDNRGAHFDLIGPDDDARQALQRFSLRRPPAGNQSSQGVSIVALDVLCIAARKLRDAGHTCDFMPADALANLPASAPRRRL